MATNKRVIRKRQRRIFSEQIRRQTVKDIEKGLCTVTQARRELDVHETTIYNWLNKYSRYLVKNRVMVVEDKSEAFRSKELEERIKELEAALGRKQMEVDLLNKIIDRANDEFKADLKKNSSKKPSNGSGSAKDHTPTK